MGLALSDSAYKRLCSATNSYVRATDPGKFIPGKLTVAEVNVLERTIINQIQSALEKSISSF